MDINEEYGEIILDLLDLMKQEIGKHYEENFIAGLERAQEIIKDYFELIDDV